MRASGRRPSMTVVMPVHNREAWVGRALESVLAQTWSDFEILVVDDGSTDGTADVLRRYLSRITLLSSPHGGAYAARNLAIRQARGALVAFIDSDDVWHPDRLECQVSLLDGLVFGDACLVDYRREPARRLGRTFFDGASPFRGRGGSGFTRGNFIPFSSVLVRRQCFETCGGFAPVRVGADYLKWFEIAHRHVLDYVPRPVCDYAIHPDRRSAPAIG
jgi:glycosyltransferase involved in cell wall biosynthesis